MALLRSWAAAGGGAGKGWGNLLGRRVSFCSAAVEPALVGGAVEATLSRSLTPAAVSSLSMRGYAVVDDAIDQDLATSFREEVVSMHARGQLHKNSTFLVGKGGGTKLLEKASIFEAEMIEAAAQEAAPRLAEMQHSTALMTLLNVYGPGLHLGSQAIKLQHNSGGGGCFPIHFDTDASLDGRRVTSILYLNPDWREGDGGELRLYPFPYGHVDVAPRLNRLVMFASANMLHRVLPASAARTCFTIWLSAKPHGLGVPGGAGSAGGAGAGRGKELAPLLQDVAAGRRDVWEILRVADYRKHIAKLVLAEEWARSIEESHADSEGRRQALETHWKEVEIIGKVFAGVLPAVLEAVEAARGEDPAAEGRIAWV